MEYSEIDTELEERVKKIPNIVFPKEELLSRVVDKHKNFIQSFSERADKIEDEIGRLEDEIKKNEDRIQEQKTMYSVLNEKPRQLCHQIANIRKNLLKTSEVISSVSDALLLSTDHPSYEEMKKVLDELESYERHIELCTFEPDEGIKATKDIKESYERMLELLGELGNDVGIANDAINKRLDEIMDAYEELKKWGEGDNNNTSDPYDRLQEMRKELLWTQNRLKSHEAALHYWLEATSEEEKKNE
ncbi:MAG: hypothetical protein ACXQS2_04165 [Methermicoccaceae archaeon]